MLLCLYTKLIYKICVSFIKVNNLYQTHQQVIVGVHDSRSILKLKSKVPIDSTETRMANVKKYADVVGWQLSFFNDTYIYVIYVFI